MALRSPQSRASHLQQLIPLLPSISSPAQVGSGQFPSLPPSLAGVVLQDPSGDSPQGPGRWSPVPPALFVSQLVSLDLPGPWDAPGCGQHPGLCKAGVGTVTSPGLPTGLGTPGTGTPPLQGMRAVPLCRAGTVRGTRRSVILLKGASTGCASCHSQGLWGLPHHSVVGGCSARGVSALCQGMGARLWCQGRGG